MRFLMKGGVGVNRAESWRVTSAMSSLCCSCFLAYSIVVLNDSYGRSERERNFFFAEAV